MKLITARCEGDGLYDYEYGPEPTEEELALEWADRLNPLEYADNPGELELQRELHRLGVRNDPAPAGSKCPECGTPLDYGSGMVGETMIWCKSVDCRYGWCDNEAAIRNVY